MRSSLFSQHLGPCFEAEDLRQRKVRAEKGALPEAHDSKKPLEASLPLRVSLDLASPLSGALLCGPWPIGLQQELFHGWRGRRSMRAARGPGAIRVGVVLFPFTRLSNLALWLLSTCVVSNLQLPASHLFDLWNGNP